MLDIAQQTDELGILDIPALRVRAGSAVLVVDDDATLRQLISLRLRLLGHEVEAVSSVPAAIETLEARTIGAIISDYSMPEATGLELLAYVERRRLSIPFVLMTGYLSEELEELALRGGAAAALDKGDLLDALPSLFYLTVPDVPTREHRRRPRERFGGPATLARASQ
jgi:CheY-like chemotaxis protein